MRNSYRMVMWKLVNTVDIPHRCIYILALGRWFVFFFKPGTDFIGFLEYKNKLWETWQPSVTQAHSEQEMVWISVESDHQSFFKLGTCCQKRKPALGVNGVVGWAVMRLLIGTKLCGLFLLWKLPEPEHAYHYNGHFSPQILFTMSWQIFFTK